MKTFESVGYAESETRHGCAGTTVSPEQQEEIDRFRVEIARIEAGETDPDDFKKFRLQNGVYGIRGTTDEHMIRVKIRYGSLTSDQLETLARIADDYTPARITHITTRQDVQFHNIKRRDVPEILQQIANSGLTTREACGNTVRNVTSCPYSGIHPDEAFDVTPYADALSLHLLRNQINQNLPRKFKIAFEGCPEDHARTPIHDFGCIAAIRETPNGPERGFRIYVGGGLGAQPMAAQLLEEFTPADKLIPTAEAVIRVFDRHGERRPEQVHRMRARLKFLIKSWGFEKIRREILIERRAIINTRSGLSSYQIEPAEEAPPDLFVPASQPNGLQRDLNYKKWLQTNVLRQKQKGWCAVTIRCPLGDISVEKLRAVAEISRQYCGGRVRATITQNLLLRWVPEHALPDVYEELQYAGLAFSDANRIADITRCPGADTCQLAITHSRGLAQALGSVLSNGLASAAEIQNLSIKISGCMNSCGQHHIADLGFYGASRNSDGREVPEYIMLVGGRTSEAGTKFGKSIAHIPAQLVPEASTRLLNYYRSNRSHEESFGEFVDRIGVSPLREVVSEFTRIPRYAEAPYLYLDLGDEAKEFKVAVGQGECAS